MEATVQEVFDEVQAIGIYHDGSSVRLLPSQMSYKLVINGFKNLLANSRQMPAFGVSLDGETRLAMNDGLWVEFDFGKKLIYSDMPFERLLVNIIANNSGFNLIRYNAEEGYNGRCFYFALDGDMSEFYDILTTV